MLCTALAAVLGVALPSAALITPKAALPAGSFVPGQLIVRFNSTTSDAARSALHTLNGARVIDRIDSLQAELLAVPDVAAAQGAYRRLGVIAEPNMRGATTGAPPPSRANDPLVAGIGPTWADRQWYLQRIGAPYTWTQYPQTYYSARTRPRTGVKVAVLDTLIDVEHRDWRNAGGVSPSIQAGGQIATSDAKSFVKTSDVGGLNAWHGTFNAGLIAASTDNSTDMAGIAYDAAIMPVAVAKGDTSTDAWTLSKGIAWATDRRARIMNVSLTIRGTVNQVSTLRAAVNRATSKGILIVSSIGNGGSDDAEYPAGFAAENPSVLAVGASDLFDRRAFCSKKGRHLSLLAPGEAIWSLDPQDHSNSGDATIRRETCGSSFATAITSGVAALVAGAYPNLTGAQIAKRILQTAEDLGAPGRDDETGAGRINAERAVWARGGPGTTWLPSPVAGPTGHVTLTAQGKSAAGIRAAEILIDGRQRGKGIAARASDGRFDESGEWISARIWTGGLTEGPHEIHVRAKDARGQWGPASTSVLIVDRSKPSVGKPKVHPPVSQGSDVHVINPDNTRSSIQMQFIDAWSPTCSVQVDLLDASFTSVATWKHKALPSGTIPLPWTFIEKAYGGPVLPGAYRLIVRVTDLAGQWEYNESPIIVLASSKIIPSPGASEDPEVPGVGTVQTKPPTALPVPRPTITPSP